MCSEVLSKLILKDEKENMVRGIKVSRKAPSITHLFYADDAIFFSQATEDNANTLLKIFEKYEAWSGQRINREKNGVVFSPNTHNSKKTTILQLLQMQTLKAKEKYLGNPFFFTGRRKDNFQFLKQKIMNRIDGWKAKCLSLAGRTTLVSSVLQSIPTYFMSTTMIPLSTCEELDRIVAKFWWLGANQKKNKYCALKSWGDLRQPKNCGGLGFRKFHAINFALIAKLFWMVLQKKDKPWINTLCVKYCSTFDAWTVEKHDSDSRVWKNILSTKKLCTEGAGVIIADGDIDIWTKPWIPWKSIQDIREGFHYNRIHAFNKVSNLFIDGTRTWNVPLIQSCFDRDITEAIINIKPIQDGSDLLFWKPAKEGKFSVKSAHWLYQHQRFNNSNRVWKELWKKKIHPRLTMMIWKILGDCLPTSGKMYFLNNPDRHCLLCNSETEDAFHLIAKCNVTRGLWFKSKWGLRLDSMGWNNVMDFGKWWTNLSDHELLLIYTDCLKRFVEFSSSDVVIEANEEDRHLLEKKDWTTTMPENTTTFTVDASVAEGWAGIATINSRGDSAVDYCLASSALEGELAAISLALSFASEAGFKRIKIESDCSVAVNGLNLGSLLMSWGSFPFFKECLFKCKDFDYVIFVLISRDANGSADSLARWARNEKIHAQSVLREVTSCCGH
uniref:Reverse transcriptase domain-containing protein n=1 Tax=Cannabis sativa TaxID=3483 RepID=A0A803QKZ2_CANSA